MHQRLILPLLFGVVSLGTPCAAEDVMLDGQPCNTFCQSWMGYKPLHPPTVTAVVPERRERPQPVAATPPRAPVPLLAATNPPTSPANGPSALAPSSPPSSAPPLPSPATTPIEEAHAPLPAAEDGAALPALDTLVAVRGSIIVETASDRALQRSRIATLLKATTRPDTAGDVRRGRQADVQH